MRYSLRDYIEFFSSAGMDMSSEMDLSGKEEDIIIPEISELRDQGVSDEEIADKIIEGEL